MLCCVCSGISARLQLVWIKLRISAWKMNIPNMAVQSGSEINRSNGNSAVEHPVGVTSECHLNSSRSINPVTAICAMFEALITSQTEHNLI